MGKCQCRLGDMPIWSGQHADVDWATFPANNATYWDSADVDWASAIVYQASYDVLLLTSANVD
jgi:hypothetical protein